MDDYGKETLKERFSEELNDVYKDMLEEEKEKLIKVNTEWNTRKADVLKAIAHYDVAMSGGINKDINTMNVDIITKIERFRESDKDARRKRKIKDIESNIFALNRLIQ
ncbi:MAG: hypothetical protein LBR68_03445 [Lachnoclostridium sp.]|nr:hypothetical protein [Lachnoclostridium sp.]